MKKKISKNNSEPFRWEKMAYFDSELWARLKKHAATTPTCPDWSKVLRPFELTPYDQTRVVILGRGPYPNPRYADGLAFSVPRDCALKPPALVNILDELRSDLGLPVPPHGDLTKWAKQGVLLLNTSLTCEPWKPGSFDISWRPLIREVFEHLGRKPHLIYVVWGKIDNSLKCGLYENLKHEILADVSPSPFFAHTGFFGSKPFSKINRALAKFPVGSAAPIDWNLND